LTRIKDQLQAAASEVDNIVFAGDVNLDTARRCNMRYSWRCLVLAPDIAVAEANMRYLTTGVTTAHMAYTRGRMEKPGATSRSSTTSA
jgi:hypothetical protein